MVDGAIDDIGRLSDQLANDVLGTFDVDPAEMAMLDSGLLDVAGAHDAAPLSQSSDGESVDIDAAMQHCTMRAVHH